MNKLLTLTFLCVLLCGCNESGGHKKPFVIIFKQPDNMGFRYVYQCDGGHQQEFIEKTDKYNIGDTLK